MLLVAVDEQAVDERVASMDERVAVVDIQTSELLFLFCFCHKYYYRNGFINSLSYWWQASGLAGRASNCC